MPRFNVYLTPQQARTRQVAIGIGLWASERWEESLWEDLANEIIIRAAEDYRMACRKLLRKPDDPLAAKLKREVAGFFRSRWFAQLSDADGEMILARLRQEEIAKEKERRKKRCTKK